VSTTPARLSDWFDEIWEAKIAPQLPFYLRTDATKKLARGMVDVTVQAAAKQATTPQGVRALIAFSRIAAILKGVNGVCDAPDPSPEEVADAVQKLVERLKP
jgi:hypothetical protein